MSLTDEIPEGPTPPQITAIVLALTILLIIALVVTLCACSTKLTSNIGNEHIEAGFNIGISTNVN